MILKLLSIRVCYIQVIKLIVEIFELREFISPFRQLLIADIRQGLGFFIPFFFAADFVYIRVPGLQQILPDILHRQVGMIGGIEPAPPEPVQIDARALLHGAEEVIGRTVSRSTFSAVAGLP